MSLEVKQMLEKERTFLETQEREYMEKEKERSREKRESRRFWVTTAIGILTALASITAAVASIISCLH